MLYPFFHPDCKHSAGWWEIDMAQSSFPFFGAEAQALAWHHPRRANIMQSGGKDIQKVLSLHLRDFSAWLAFTGLCCEKCLFGIFQEVEKCWILQAFFIECWAYVYLNFADFVIHHIVCSAPAVFIYGNTMEDIGSPKIWVMSACLKITHLVDIDRGVVS